MITDPNASRPAKQFIPIPKHKARKTEDIDMYDTIYESLILREEKIKGNANQGHKSSKQRLLTRPLVGLS